MRTPRQTLNPLNYYLIKVKGCEERIIKVENHKDRTVPIFPDIENDPPDEAVEGQVAISEADGEEKIWWYSNGAWHTCGKKYDTIDDSAFAAVPSFASGQSPGGYLHDIGGLEFYAYNGTGSFNFVSVYDGATVTEYGPYGDYGVGHVIMPPSLASDGTNVWLVSQALKTFTCAVDGNPWDEYHTEVRVWNGSGWTWLGPINPKTANNGADFLASEYFGWTCPARACAIGGKLYVYWSEGGHDRTTLANDAAERYIERSVIAIYSTSAKLVENEIFYSDVQDDTESGGSPTDPYRTVYGHSVPSPNNSKQVRLTALGGEPLMIRVPPSSTDHDAGYNLGEVYDSNVEAFVINSDATITSRSTLLFSDLPWSPVAMSDPIYNFNDIGMATKLWTDPIDGQDVIYVDFCITYLSHGSLNSLMRLKSDGTAWSWFENDSVAYPAFSPARIPGSNPIYSIMPETDNVWITDSQFDVWHWERQCPHLSWLHFEVLTPFGTDGYQGSSESFEAWLDGDWIYYGMLHDFGVDGGFGKSHICRKCADC